MTIELPLEMSGYEGRIGRVRVEMEKEGYDAILVSASEHLLSNPGR